HFLSLSNTAHVNISPCLNFFPASRIKKNYTMEFFKRQQSFSIRQKVCHDVMFCTSIISSTPFFKLYSYMIMKFYLLFGTLFPVYFYLFTNIFIHILNLNKQFSC